MKTGAITKMGDLNRVVIPISMREALNINYGDSVEEYSFNDMIVIRKVSATTKQVGVLRKVDNVGRLVIPKRLSEELGIYVGDSVSMLINEDMLIVKKLEKQCKCCGNRFDLIKYKGMTLCGSCVEQFRILGGLK